MNNNIVFQFLKIIQNNLNEIDYNELTKLCNIIVPSLPINILDFTNERTFFNQADYYGLNVVYRARKSQMPPFQNINELSYIPSNIKKIGSYGRVNKPGESMFYGSLNFGAACLEYFSKGEIFQKNRSAVLTVGAWKFETPLTLAKMEFSEKYFQLFLREIGLKSDNLNLENIKKKNYDFKKQFKDEKAYEIFSFFSDEFAKFNTTNDNEYKLCNYYADRVFNRIKGFEIDEKIDGILYPSVASCYEQTNIVLKPSVVDNNLKFIEAFDVWVTIWDNKDEIRFDSIGKRVKANNKGELNWFL